MKNVMIVFVLLFGISFSQSKIGYIDSQEIWSKSSEAKTIQNKIQNLGKEYEELNNKLKEEIQDLSNKLETQKLILTEKKKEELMKKIDEKNREYYEFQQTKTLYPNGEFYQKVAELRKPLIEKILKAVEAISKEKGLDIVFNNEQSIILYTNSGIDYTKEVLDYMEKNTSKKK